MKPKLYIDNKNPVDYSLGTWTRTMISSRVSRLTLKGIFFMTIAVGIISSSLDAAVRADGTVPIGFGMWCIGGEPPDDMSELDGGDMERASGIVAWFSSHCYVNKRGGKQSVIVSSSEE